MHLYRRAILTALMLAIVPEMLSTPGGHRFFHDDPLLVEPETQDASRVTPVHIDLLYDLLLNQFTRPGIPPGSRAQNVNTIDEVPDSAGLPTVSVRGRCLRASCFADR